MNGGVLTRSAPQVRASVRPVPRASLHAGHQRPSTRQRGPAAEGAGLRRAAEHGGSQVVINTFRLIGDCFDNQ